MKIDRLEKIFKQVNPRKFDVRNRHPVLQSLEGWYSVASSLPEKYQKLFKEYEESSTRLKFTRWLSKNNKLPLNEISVVGQYLKEEFSFKISCRHNDLLRLAETPHYTSCLKNWKQNGRQQFFYLSDPDIAVVFVSDKAGKFIWRALVRLIFNPQSPSGYALFLYQPYGNGDTKAISKKLNELLPLYLGTGNYNKQAGVKVCSPTIFNNKVVSKPIWCDHPYEIVNDRIQLWGIKFRENYKWQIHLY